MLAKNVEIIDIEPGQHERLFSLFTPGRAAGKKHGLVLFYSDNRLFHAVHTKYGPVMDVLKFRGPAHLRELAEERKVDFIVCMERNVLRRIAADAQSAVLFDDPLSAQGLAVYDALKRELGGGLHIYPDPLARLPRIPPSAARIGRKLFLGNTLVIAAVFDEAGDVWTSMIIEFRNAEISLITTTDFLEPMDDLKGLSVEEAARKLVHRLEQKRGRPAVGLFCDREAFAHIVNHPKPVTALLHLAKLGWIRIHPFPARLRMLVRFASLFGL